MGLLSAHGSKKSTDNGTRETYKTVNAAAMLNLSFREGLAYFIKTMQNTILLVFVILMLSGWQ